MRVRALPHLDDEDGVGLLVIHADLIAEAPGCAEVITASGEVCDEVIAVSGYGTESAGIHEGHGIQDTAQRELDHNFADVRSQLHRPRITALRVGSVQRSLAGDVCHNWAMTRTALDFDENWFDDAEFAQLRRRLPIPYVNAIPVRVGESGNVERIGLLLRSLDDGTLGREVVGGRIRFHESIRTALMRHAENDLGPMALPVIPPAISPFHIAEYFPTEGSSLLYDPRQHAISMCFILEVRGECTPRADALSLDWLTPEETLGPDIVGELCHGQEHILRYALAHMGFAI